MVSTQTRFSDQRYLNWLKDTLSLLYLKEGIESIVDAEAIRFHLHLQQAIGVSGAAPQLCFTCTPNCMTKDFRRRMWHMPCSLCNSWLQQIIQNHSNQPLPNLSPENTNPQLWSTDPNEILKCYMPHGCQRNQSAKDGDAQGILSLLKNCLHFTTCGRIGRIDLIDELLRVRNSLFHSGKFLVDDADLQVDMQTMLDFLRGMTSLSAAESQSVQQAMDKITELQTNRLDLSLNRELELQALQQKQNALDRDLKRLEHELIATAAKTSSTEDAVQTIQQDIDLLETNVQSLQQESHSHSSKTDMIETELKSLGHEVRSKLPKTGSLRTDVRRLQHKSRCLDKGVKALQDEVASGAAKATATETDVNTLKGKTHTLGKKLRKLQGVQDLFNRFLEANNLAQDITGLSTNIERLGQRVQHLEEQTQRDHGPQEISEEDVSSLRAALIKYYREYCLLVPNPVVEEELGLEEVYVSPNIKVLRETKTPRAGLVNVQNRTTLGNMSKGRQIFYTEDYKSKQIYITGNAGIGKSMFCKHLVYLWCDGHSDPQANCPEKSNCADSDLQERKRQTGEICRQTMSEFKLLFYISLRDSMKQYSIVEMIDSQIFQVINCTKPCKASDILKREDCLVILDGLDEWVCPKDAHVPHFVNPGIPGRLGLNSNNVYLTTTRPWKFDVLQLKSSEVDKHVELVGLDRMSSRILCSNIIKLLNNMERVKRTALQFWEELSEKRLTHFHNIPVILTQLVCLWFDKQDLGQTKVQLYCSMLEMMLKRAIKNFLEQPCTGARETEHTEKLLPKCFSNRLHCQAHHDLLVSLCKVAFEALFDQKRENALVFESSQMKIFGVDQTNIDLCLKSGILSQNKVLGRWSVCEKKMSFLHKRLQEFLAATFIANYENVQSAIARVKTFCGTVETVLEMSQVWMFVSGIKADLARQLLTDLITDVVFNDRRLEQDRQTLLDSPHLAQSMQTCVVDCVVEARSNGNNDFCLPLEDFVIDEETISECLENLLTLNIAAVKSVYINTRGLTGERVQTLEHILSQLHGTHCLQKLFLYDFGYVITDKESLCQTLVNNQNTLTCLSVYNITLTTQLYVAVLGKLKHITALELGPYSRTF